MAISKDALYLGEEFVKASTGSTSGVTNLINLTNETLNKPGEPQILNKGVRSSISQVEVVF